MRASILTAAIALTIAALAIGIAPHAEAGYISPEWSWQMKAFCTRGC